MKKEKLIVLKGNFQIVDPLRTNGRIYPHIILKTKLQSRVRALTRLMKIKKIFEI